MKKTFIGIVIIFLLWQAIVLIAGYPEFILPSPIVVLVNFWENLLNGLLIQNSLVTFTEIILGLFLGLSLAFPIGYFLAKFPSIKSLFLPIVVIFSTIPIVALAPLVIIWLGWGLAAKVVICSLTLFFPVVVNTYTGFSGQDENYIQLMDSFKADFWQKLIIWEIPASLPILFAGLKIGVTLSVIGAVVGEFVASDKGLGFLINLAGGLYDTPLRFSAFLMIGIISVSLYSLVNLLEKRIIKWQ
jgi:NitT/TauT family transport system permease protein